MKRPRGLQVTRRGVQLLFLVLVLVTPVLARYANRLSTGQLDHLLEEQAGSAQARALESADWLVRGTLAPDIVVEGQPRRDAEGAVAAASAVRGTSWAFEVFGLRFTDPLGAVESALASRSLRGVLLWGLALPLLLSIFFGRVFCSWICPVGTLLEWTDGLRRRLRKLDMRPGRVKLWSGDKYLVLAVGLGLSFAIGLPLLGSFYPPALLGREVQSGWAVFFDRGDAGLTGLTAAGLSLAAWFLILIVLVEVALAPRLWCRALCPGGALYALLGAGRLVRLRRTASTCTDCGDCNVHCGMGLDPMRDRTGIDCDNCGVCIAHCPEGSLEFGLLGRATPSEPPAQPPNLRAQ